MGRLARPGSGEVHVWATVAPALKYDQLRATLSPDELARAERFRFEPDRLRFINRRGLLRLILASYLDTSPASLRFTYTDFGKPSLEGRVKVDNLTFNLSHSGELVRIAIGVDREVGIDVEVIDQSVPIDSVAKNFFTPSEIAELASLPESLRRLRFFCCWTRKEAYLKARGSGLTIPLDSFDVSGEPSKPRLLVEKVAPNDFVHWRIETLENNGHHSTTVAAMGRNWKVLRRTLSAEIELSKVLTLLRVCPQ